MTRSLRAVLLALAAVALSSIGYLERATAQVAPLQDLDVYIEQARRDWDVPGLAVVIVKDDRVVYAQGFGVREQGKPGRVDPDTVFAIGSASKAFTGAALAMLVDEGRIAWDGPVHGYMPAFELHDPYATRHATVRDLLSHRTGFSSGYGWLWTGSGFDRNEIIRRLRFQESTLGFRNQFAYANEMYTAAGEIVPAVTGTSWDAFMADRFFRPMGMTRSSTSIDALARLANVARPHGTVDGRLVSFPYRRIDNVGGAGAINASARDLAQWVRLQLGDGMYDGKRLISAAAIADTRTGQMVPRGGLGQSTPDAEFGEYGLGWIVNEYRGRKVVQHGGAVDGMLGLVGMIPEEKLGIVVLTNRLPHALTWALQYTVFDRYLGGGGRDWSAFYKERDDAAKAAAAKAEAAAAVGRTAAPALPLDRYAGTFTSDMYGDITVAAAGGRLTLTRPTAAAALLPDRQHRFRAKWSDPGILSVFGETPVAFSLDADGQVAGFDLGPDRFVRKAAAKP